MLLKAEVKFTNLKKKKKKHSLIALYFDYPIVIVTLQLLS